MEIKLITALLIALAGINLASAQDTTTNKTDIPYAYWVDLGFGTTSLTGAGKFVYGNAQITKNILITGGLQVDTDQPLSQPATVPGWFGFSVAPYTETDLYSASVLIGKIKKYEYSMWTVSAGLAYTTYQQSYHQNPGVADNPVTLFSKDGIGIPVLVRAYLVMGQCFGLGVGLHANFNTVKSTGGLDLIFSFGRIQTHYPRVDKSKHDPLHIFH